MGKKKKESLQFWESATLNNKAYNTIYDSLISVANTTFKYKNMPTTVDTIALENTLLYNGSAVIVYDDILNAYYGLPFTQISERNIYGFPIAGVAHSRYNGYNISFNDVNGQIMYDNTNKDCNTLNIVRYYTYKLYNITRTFDTATLKVKNPIIVLTPEGQRLSVENALMKAEGNQYAVIADKGYDVNTVKLMLPETQYVGEELLRVYSSVWNEALALLGRPTYNFFKRERLTQTESIAVDRNSKLLVNPRLDSRKQAIEALNKKFGLNVSVTVNEEEVIYNESIHNPS